MPLEIYARGPSWWARGRVEFNGRAISRYYRSSTGASSEAGARDWCRAEEERQIRRHLLGDEASLTFAEAVLIYPAKPSDARYLLKVTVELGDHIVPKITPEQIRQLAPQLYPDASTDTWKRQVLVPVSAVINHAHALGRCPPIRIRGYSTKERIDQDARRGKTSRVEKIAGSWEWITAFQAQANPYLGALAEFMFETGARISQAVALVPSDLDLMNRRVWLSASKGHAAQWVTISTEMVVRLANLPPRRPVSRAQDKRLPPRVFGYQDRSGPKTAWAKACDKAGIPHLSPHAAGRHGFYTELRVRQGQDPIATARAGRWASHALPDRAYAHAETGEAALRALIRTSRVQGEISKPVKALTPKKRT